MDSNGYGLDLHRESSYNTPFAANSTLLLQMLLSLMKQPRTPKINETLQSEYDYIIVGGGTAGSALASRLSEDSCRSVLLLEAGGHAPISSEVPAIGLSMWGTDVDWKYHTVPQRKAALAITNQKLPFPTGKVLGGCTILNALLYFRGNHRNFDGWAESGAKGWSYEEVLPFFKRSEDNAYYAGSKYHGVGGPLTVSHPNYDSPLKEYIFEAARQLGYRVGDVNGKTQTGFTSHQAALRNGQRCSAAKAYLVPAENRTNLNILLNAHVQKINITGNPLKARSVIFKYKNNTYTVRAKKEIILSAGAINSPQLLMLSGVGPKNELLKHKIPLLVDLPVGENFMDHPVSFLNYVMKPGFANAQEKFKNTSNIQEYIDHRSGPLASIGLEGAVAFLQGHKIHPKEDFPNYQIYFAEAEASVFQAYGVNQKVFDEYYRPNAGKPLLYCGSQIVQPRSRGRVTLNSRDPLDPPLIDPNYFDDPRDIEDILQGLKTCIAIIESEPIQKAFEAKPFEQLFPGCENEKGDNYLRCFIKRLSGTTSHFVGTARMGDPSNKTTVVDPHLRVKGVQGLRVVDASIMPMVTSSNTMTPVYMIAEKAASIIKYEYPECETTI